MRSNSTRTPQGQTGPRDGGGGEPALRGDRRCGCTVAGADRTCARVSEQAEPVELIREARAIRSANPRYWAVRAVLLNF